MFQQIVDWFVSVLRAPLAELRGADPVLGLAVVVLAALVLASALHRRLRLPRLLGYLLVGAVASPALLGLLQRTDIDPWKPLIDLAVAALVFELGTRLRPRWLIDNPWLAASSALDAIATGGAVWLVLVALGAPSASAAAAAALAAATSPVITMAAFLEARPRGQVAERLLMLSAINSTLAILAVKLWPVLAQKGLSASDSLTLLANASVVIFGSLLLGLACGVLLDRLGRLHDEAATMPVLQLALVILAALLAVAWGLSPFIALLVAGMTARSRMRHRLTVQPYLGSAGAALTVMLFVSFGVLSTLQDWRALWPWVLAIIAARLVSKGIAIFATARPSGLSWRQATALTLALQPMSSLSVLLVADSFGWRQQLPGADAAVIQALLIATTLMQLSGPLWTLWPLKRIVGEAGEDGSDER
ncbi:MAG TPA: cation:proton antiporter [Burkholderiaceae bacterium]|nr:cation:proton antiporter [Burkholderiaceae bacterium]